MAKSLADLKRKSVTDKISDLATKIDSIENKSKYEADTRFWKPTLDASGNGSALIRFLPEPVGEDFPFVKVYSHFFKGPTGKVYAENSLTTLNQKDPVSEHNSKLWNSGVESDKKIARNQKRKLSHYSNILVINDPKNPENNGKVFLFKYGIKIMNKIQEAMFPPEDELDPKEPLLPFDLWSGADFKLIVRSESGADGKYVNYDRSSFTSSGKISLFSDLSEEEYDDKVEELWKKCHSLTELVSPSQFKTYDELKRKLDDVLSLPATSTKPAEKLSSKKDVYEEDEDSYEEEVVDNNSFDDIDDIARLLAEDDPI
jgi:hypothetical protein